MSPIKRLLTFSMILLIAISAAGCSGLMNSQENAAKDFHAKYGLVQSQQQNVAYSLNLTAGRAMDQPSLESVLGTQYSMITVLIERTGDATAAGNAYLRYLQPDSMEYANVTANIAQMSDYLNVSRTQYNSGAAMYNNYWGGVNGTMPYV